MRIKLDGTPPFEMPAIHSSAANIKGENVEMVINVLAGNKLLPVHVPMTFDIAEALALQLGTAVFRARTSQK